MKLSIIMLTFSLFQIFGSSFVKASPIDDLKLMTEQYPPFNFKKDRKIQGISIDLMEEMLKRSGSKLTRKDFDLVTWSRAYNSAIKKKNHVVFATTRTKEREGKFKWVGPISNTRIVIIAKKSSKLKVSEIEDLKKYRIGVIKDDIGAQLLLKAGIPKKNLDSVYKTSRNIKKLIKGRIDGWAYAEKVAFFELRNIQGVHAKDFETVYVLSEGEVWYAFNKDTDDKIINSLQTSLDGMLKDKTYQAILAKYID